MHILSKTTNMAETQGDLLAPSLSKLLMLVPLNNADVFVDLGSAAGEVATQVFLQTPAKEVIGIEIIPHLHDQALQCAQHIDPAYYSNQRRLTFILGDFLTIPFSQATVIWISSICFNQQLLFKLNTRFKTLQSLHTLFTLRPLPDPPLPFRKTIRVECSWDSALCYVYSTVTDFAKLRG